MDPRDPPSSTPPPDVLGGFGQLREALSALQNLEHLLGSVQIGPKVLAQIIPELESHIPTWQKESSTLIHYSAVTLGGMHSLVEFEGTLHGLLTEFSQALRQASLSPMSAKHRLGLERDMHRLVPAISTALDHLELLVEATWARGIPLSLKELLLSRPDTGSERPHRPVQVAGDTESVEVQLPPRIALRVLGALMTQAGPKSGLRVEHDAEHCTLFIEENVVGSMTAHLPLLPSLTTTTTIAQRSLSQFGGRLSSDGRILTLPRSHTTSTLHLRSS